ncbi:hypothetical protein Aasi_1614 [Candidatus Amoebophilus asiaticus 5a2]|uniref:Uncharacterized protein n=1 Tax=Amoebophilus asiaticus (strain 5a2) TaxID=452471 RepID=C3L4L0_AMOA5|nr:hypothetical protein Aasi_1614 [Candidatus Amoebophilus asiaticus 5a2]
MVEFEISKTNDMSKDISAQVYDLDSLSIDGCQLMCIKLDITTNQKAN